MKTEFIIPGLLTVTGIVFAVFLFIPGFIVSLAGIIWLIVLFIKGAKNAPSDNKPLM